MQAEATDGGASAAKRGRFASVADALQVRPLPLVILLPPLSSSSSFVSGPVALLLMFACLSSHLPPSIHCTRLYACLPLPPPQLLLTDVRTAARNVREAQLGDRAHEVTEAVLRAQVSSTMGG